ncbi:MAG: hypothetical protein NTU76_03750 [Candidatus Taylorbacteria bacterium]|nr:hypothetical protein [Candidatus Taylorbacteria bacterium]
MKIITRRVSFKDGENNMLIVSQRRPGESKKVHENRIVNMKKIMIETSHEENKSKHAAIITKYQPYI